MNMNKQKRIFIIAGESSGDQHAAAYLREHHEINPDIVFDAFGQRELKNTTANIIYDTENISVVGILEVLSKYKENGKIITKVSISIQVFLKSNIDWTCHIVTRFFK